MRLLRLDLENFRRIQNTTINFSPSTFMVGPNNTAKSSVIASVEALLFLEREKLTQQDILDRHMGQAQTKQALQHILVT
jgi:predicted ATP-dependent endonuclease of OLD family